MQEERADNLPSSPEASPSGSRRRERRKRRSLFTRLRTVLQGKSATVLTVLLSIAILASLLAVGTVHVATLLILSPVAILAGAFALFVDDDTRLSQRLPALVALLLSIYSLLQSIPLPPQVLAAISPQALQVWSDAMHLACVGTTRWASISLDPGASRVEALKWFCYAALYLAGARLAKERGSQTGAVIVVSAAVIAGTLSIAHGLVEMESWFGFYKPQYAHPPWALAPLLNPNNFASYLNLALFCGLGLLFVRKPPVARWGIGLGVAFLAAHVVLTASRGGVLALLIALGFSGLAFRQQQRRASLRGGFVFPVWLPLAAVTLAAAALVVLGATDVIWRDLRAETIDKLLIFERSKPIVVDFPWTGIGRGAFETVFPAYRTDSGFAIAQYAENFIVQWIVEWGLPVALPALLTLGWAMRPRRHGFARNAVPTGIYLGLSALLLQNLVDLATEIASIGFATALLVGTLSGGSEYFANRGAVAKQSRRKQAAPLPSAPGRSPRTVILQSTVILLTGLLLVLAARTGRTDALNERWLLAQELKNVSGQPKASDQANHLKSDVQSALLRHPADPYLPLIGALLAPQSSKEALSWHNQALRRDPMGGRPHLLLAETLAARGATNQALFELKRTAELEPELGGEVAVRIFRWAKTTPEILRAIPEGKPGIGVLNVVAAQFRASPEHRQLYRELLNLSLARDSGNGGTNAIFAMDFFEWLGAGDAACLGEKQSECETQLRKHANVVIKDAKNQQQSLLMKGRLLNHEKKYAEAEQLLAEGCPHAADPVGCQSARVTYAVKLEDASRFEEAANAYISVACSTAAACSNATAWIGALEYQRQNYLSALARYERSAQELPSAESWLRVADVAIKVGRVARAETAMTAARRLSSADTRADIDAKMKELQRQRLMRELEAPNPKLRP